LEALYLQKEIRINKLYNSFIKYLYRLSNYGKLILKRIVPAELWLNVRSFLPRQTFHTALAEIYIKEWQEGRKASPRHPGSHHYDGGINLIGYLRAVKGISEAARSSALALRSTRIPYSIIDYENGIPVSQQIEVLPDSPYGTSFQFNANLIHINPPQLPFLWSTFSKEDLTGRYNIGVWYWELPELPEEWLPAFGLVDEVWAATQFILNSVSVRSPIPVIKIPPCIHPVYDPHLTRLDYGLPADRFLFMCAYDVLSIQARKNPLGAIDAFKQAFPKNDSSTGLVIKVNNATENPQEVRQLHDQIRGYSNCYIIDDVLVRPAFNSLLNVVDAYISLHRSEGFGLIPAEAMSFGKPVVMTRWSGNLDFMTPDNSCGVDYELVPVSGQSGPYKAGQLWADPDIDHASFFIQKLASDQKYYAEISEQAKKTIQNDFSPHRIGQLMQERMKEIGLI
jgi:glycosyltransferase involved in cell wall biosynthesis